MIAPDEKMQFVCISESDVLLLNKGYIEDTWSIFDTEVRLHDPRNKYIC